MPSIDDSKCILVTGATAGIGRGLALALAKLQSKPRVIAVGRRKSILEELAKSGLETVEFDMNTDSSNLKKFADGIVQKYPEVSRLTDRRQMPCSSTPSSTMQAFNMSFISRMKSILTVSMDFDGCESHPLNISQS